MRACPTPKRNINCFANRGTGTLAGFPTRPWTQFTPLTSFPRVSGAGRKMARLFSRRMTANTVISRLSRPPRQQMY